MSGISSVKRVCVRMADPTPIQIKRYGDKLPPSRGGSLYAGVCIRCGRDYMDCPCSSGEVRNLAEQIERLPLRERNNIMQKGTPVKSTADKADELVAKANELLKAAEELRSQAAQEAKYRYPAEPHYPKGSISVKFRGNSQWYEYLVIRVPGKGYYTTGQGETAHFTTWRSFIDWLRSDDVADCGKYTSLVLGTSELVVP
jgi:hypothetical protein